MKNYLLLILLVFCVISVSVNAQINIREKVRNQSVNRADNKIDQGIDKSLNAAEDKVKDLFKKKKKTREEGPDEEQSEEQAMPEAKKALAAYSKFDFIPGEKVIFYDDFSQDAVGDFPALWFSDGSGEVVTMNNLPGKWLNLTAEGCYYPERDLPTSANFTVEFDLVSPMDQFELGFYLVAGDIKDPNEGGAIPGRAGVKTSITHDQLYYSGYDKGEYTLDGNADLDLKPNEPVHLSYQIQKQRLRIYVNERKVIDSPRVIPLGYNYNMLRFQLSDVYNPYITNFRVAAGLPDTRDKLITEGKLVTYGIYFDVNKDVVKPESYGTLKEIASILNEVPDVRVKIFGHTDADGEDSKNMDLSKRRAASVKAELAKSFGVNTDRLDTDGWGETKPVAPNDSPVNKALNRRVEFVKL